MIYVGAVLLSELFFMSINMIWMRLRRRGLSSASILALYVFSIPVWGALAVYQLMQHNVNLSSEYWFYAVSWAIVCCFANLLNVYVFRYVSLLEVAGYRFAMSVGLALLVDIFLFKLSFSPWIMFFILLTFIGGVCLNFLRTQHFKHQKNTSIERLPLYKILAIVLLVSALTVFETSLLKEAMRLQDNFIFYAATAQSLLFGLFFMIGGRAMVKDFQAHKFHKLEVLGIIFFILCACLLEAYSYVQLPLSIIILLTIFRPLIFSLHDMWTQDLPITKASLASMLCIFVGILGVGWLQNVLL